MPSPTQMPRCPATLEVAVHEADIHSWDMREPVRVMFHTVTERCVMRYGHHGHHFTSDHRAWRNDATRAWDDMRLEWVDCEPNLAAREQPLEDAWNRTRVRSDAQDVDPSPYRATNTAPQAADTSSVGHDTTTRTEGTHLMRYCTRCHTRQDDDAFRYVASQGRYHSWCRSCERAARRNAPRRVRTATRQGRAFGVEIELTGPSRNIITTALYAIGIDVHVRGYAATNGDRWELKTDASVNGQGLELVSPKLYGDAGIATLENVLAALNSVGATVDRSCGIHVHIDFRNRTATQIKNAILPIVRTQDAIYAMCAPSRRSNHYSSAWSAHDLQSLQDATSLNQIAYTGPRGFVNLGSYTRHGSVEFRSHGGSTNAKKITAWVRMIQAAVAYGEANPGAGSLGATAADVCRTLNLSNDDTQALTRFERAAATLEANEYLGV